MEKKTHKLWVGPGFRPGSSAIASGDESVASIRGLIDGRKAGHHAIGAMAARLTKALAAAALAAALALPLALVIGIGAYALIVAAVAAAHLAIPYARGRGKRDRKGAEGILLGTSYPRTVTSYADYDSGNAVYESVEPSVRGEAGAYRIDLLSEPNQHVLIAGSSSSGKTTTLKALLARASLQYGISFLAIDWQGELESFAAASGAVLWKVPGNFTLNIFRLNGMDAAQRASMVEEGLMAALQLTQLQATRVKDALMSLYAGGGEPSLRDLWGSLSQRRENYLIGYRLKAVERVIGEEPDAFWNGIAAGSAVLSLSGLNDNEKSLVTYFILQRVCELFEAGEMGSKPRLLIAIDEAWQLMSRQQPFLKLPNAHEMLAEKIVRLGRKYGFGIITSTQQLEDLPDAFINSSSVIMLHSYRQQWKNNALSLNALDMEYVKSAAQGECLVMDRYRAQKGQTWLDYVKVSPLGSDELERLRLHSNPAKPAELRAQASTISIAGRHEVHKGRVSIPLGAPSPSEHAAMLAIYRNAGAEKPKLVSYIKEKGWIGSDATIYGYQGKPGILEKLVSAGFAKEEGGRYGLAEQGKRWVDPEYIMANQSDKLGSEEHKRLMAKTIEKLHEENMLVITSSAKHSPDLVSFPVSRSKRYLWDVASAMGYEIQTSARKEAIEMNESKTGMPITWVADNEQILKAIKQVTNENDSYILISFK